MVMVIWLDEENQTWPHDNVEVDIEPLTKIL